MSTGHVEDDCVSLSFQLKTSCCLVVESEYMFDDVAR